jgi:hypothetical protein
MNARGEGGMPNANANANPGDAAAATTAPKAKVKARPKPRPKALKPTTKAIVAGNEVPPMVATPGLFLFSYFLLTFD